MRIAAFFFERNQDGFLEKLGRKILKDFPENLSCMIRTRTLCFLQVSTISFFLQDIWKDLAMFIFNCKVLARIICVCKELTRDALFARILQDTCEIRFSGHLVNKRTS